MLRGLYDRRKRVPYEKLDWTPDLPIVVISADVLEHYDLEPAADIEAHWHNSVELIYTNESSSRVVVNGVGHKLHPQELFVINSQHVHYFPEVSSDFTGCTMQVEYQFAKGVLPNLDEVVFEVTPQSQGYVLPIFQEVARLYLEDEHANADVIIILTQALLLTLLKRCGVQRIQKTNKLVHDNQILLQALSYLDSCYMDEVSIGSLAEQCNVSYAYLARLFKENLGMSAKQYLTAKRYERARFQLMTTDDSITEIALRAGFPSVSAFIREFKRREDSTPEAFRQALLHSV